MAENFRQDDRVVVEYPKEYGDYFRSWDPNDLRSQIAREMQEIGGDFEDVNLRIKEILKFSRSMGYVLSFLKHRVARGLEAKGYELIKQLATSQLDTIGEEIKKRKPYPYTDKQIVTLVSAEIYHSTDPRNKALYDRHVGLPLFNSVPSEFIFSSPMGYKNIGLLGMESTYASNARCPFSGCQYTWNEGFRVVSSTGRILSLNDGVAHFVQAHHLFECPYPRQPYDLDNLGNARNPYSISPTDFYHHFMQKSE